MLYWLFRWKWFRGSLFSFLAALQEGAHILLIAGLMGMPDLCSLSSAFRVGGVGFLLGHVFDLVFVDNMVALLQGF